MLDFKAAAAAPLFLFSEDSQTFQDFDEVSCRFDREDLQTSASPAVPDGAAEQTLC